MYNGFNKEIIDEQWDKVAIDDPRWLTVEVKLTTAQVSTLLSKRWKYDTRVRQAHLSVHSEAQSNYGYYIERLVISPLYSINIVPTLITSITIGNSHKTHSLTFLGILIHLQMTKKSVCIIIFRLKRFLFSMPTRFPILIQKNVINYISSAQDSV